MPIHYDLIVTPDTTSQTAEFRLLSAHGSQLAYRLTDFKKLSASHKQCLFDLGNYLRRYVDPNRQAASMTEIGVCIAEQVLGEKIFRTLWGPTSQRILRIQLSGATDENNHLAALLARVPWEIARPAANQPTLAERNLLLRIAHDRQAPPSQPLEFGGEESLRVLFVFAESRGSRPLAARSEHQALRELFEREIYPRRRILADFLTHGVTRERLEAQVRENGGYHVVHWSGHGDLNLLELAQPGGASDQISGEDLLALFVRAGGFIPRLCFLSACHSGKVRPKDWDDFFDAAQGRQPVAKETGAAASKDIPLNDLAAYTGTAHALLDGGVSSVVAMRYAVGDDYARDLAVEFYRRLLADAQPKSAAAALAMARQSLLDPRKPSYTRYTPCDHATPLLYGDEQPCLALAPGRSPALDTRNPRLHSIAELTWAAHEHFVGRTWELAGLGADFIGSGSGGEAKAAAAVTGLGGMGKTALTAEILALWEQRYTWVLLYQAKPNALSFETIMLDIHIKLKTELGRYHDHVKYHPGDAVYREASSELSGRERLEKLVRNLVRAMRDEAILLILDNFETNLKPRPEPETGEGQPVWACQDPAWDHCLTALAQELVRSPSRVLVTSRYPLAALTDGTAHLVVLGPLPPEEAALYLRTHKGLSDLVFGGDGKERKLAERLLQASRFHPLLMDRLARLAADPKLRPQLLQALDTLEQTQSFAQLPALFSTQPGETKELAYLNDALATSLDLLIRELSPDARRLLWMVAVANEPVTLELLKSVWSRESSELQHLRRTKRMMGILPPLPPEIRARIDALPPELPVGLEVERAVRQLVGLGLATGARNGPANENPIISCHELVREHIRAWMEQHPQERAEQTENTIRVAYAERLEIEFHIVRHINMDAALQIGSHALIYYAQADAWDRLGSFASWVATGTNDPHLLGGLIPYLRTATEVVPKDWHYWMLLADAVCKSGDPETSLPIYERAAALARASAENENSSRTWEAYATICGNWAIALQDNGQFEDAHPLLLLSADTHRRCGSHHIFAIWRELQALRLEIWFGGAAAETAFPKVEARVAEMEAWWQQYLSGEFVTSPPDAELLIRALLDANGIAREAACKKKDWASARRRVDFALDIIKSFGRPSEDLAGETMNRAVVLSKMGHWAEAKADLEACLASFENFPAAKARTLSNLAKVFHDLGDVDQAIVQERRALALRETLPNPFDRGASHLKLGGYLDARGTPADVSEAVLHYLANLLYLRIDSRGIQADGTVLALPRVADLLADPAFRPLADWLAQRKLDPVELQTAVEDWLEQARQITNPRPE